MYLSTFTHVDLHVLNYFSPPSDISVGLFVCMTVSEPEPDPDDDDGDLRAEASFR